MLRLSIAAAFIAGLCSGRIGEEAYGIRPRRREAETRIFSLGELQQYQISFSDDSPPIKLTPFYLNLFETTGSLPVEPSIRTIEEGLNEYLMAELNAIYDRNNQIEDVDSTVLTQANAASSRFRRNLQATGSQLETQVTAAFANTPSPDETDLQQKVTDVMSQADLTPLLNNITSRRAEGDYHLANLSSIYYLEMLDDPDDSNGGTPSGIENERDAQPTVSESFLKLEVFIPTILACFVVIALVALFTVRKRKRDVRAAASEMALTSTQANHEMKDRAQRETSSPPPPENDQDINLFWTGSENLEDYADSVEATLVDTPRTSPKKAHEDNYSDIFSDVGYDASASTLSPSTAHGGADSKSVFSFLSGFTSRGEASTVVASNVTTPATGPSSAGAAAAAAATTVAAGTVVAGASPSATYSGTPHSRVSSLFTFSEEDSQDLYSSSDEKQKDDKAAKAERSAITTAAASQQQIKSVPSDEQTPASTPASTTVNAAANGAGGASNTVALTSVAAGTALAAGAATAVLLNATKSKNDDQEDNTKTATSRSASPDITNKELLRSTSQSPDNASAWNCHSPFKKKNNESTETNNLTADQIKNELQAAEEEHKKNGGLSVITKDEEQSSSPMAKVSRFFSFRKPEESPAAKSYNFEREASPRSESETGYNTDPGTDQGSAKNTVGGILKLQWDSPTHSSSMQRVSSKTIASGETVETSGGQRVRQLTGSNKVKRNTKSSSGSISTFDTGTTGDTRSTRLQQLTASAAAGAVLGALATSTDAATTTTDESPPVTDKGRRSSMTPGVADGTAEYQNDAALAGSPTSDMDTDGEDSLSVEEAKRRRHAKSTTGDGTKNYQNETMGEWSVEEGDDPLLETRSSSSFMRRRGLFGMKKSSSNMKPPKSPTKTAAVDNETPKSAATNNSTISALSQNSPSANSEASASKQLISDLLWLEQKISKTNQAASMSPENKQEKKPDEEQQGAEIAPSDSMSFTSGDGMISTDGDSTVDKSETKDSRSFDDSTFSSIVCRDCYAPPGKLKIVIHSTKDGPAVHTVKKGSTLEGHIFPGDLIISVDNVDTRSYSAEQVMKMMTAKTRFERKITVLHFEDVTKSS